VEPEEEEIFSPGKRIRLAGGRRKKQVESDPTLLEPKGDHMSLVRWTTKSDAKLKEALLLQGHRLFSYISINWRAKPLTSLETIIELISHTTSKEGLTVTL